MEDGAYFDGDGAAVEFIWSNEKLDTLITLYSHETFLWDTTSGFYHNRQERDCAYARIAQDLECNVEEVTRKLRHLRTYYARELTKVKKSLLENTSRQPYKSNWIWYPKIDEFLRNHMTQLPPRVSVAAERQCRNRSSLPSVAIDDSPSPPAATPESSESSFGEKRTRNKSAVSSARNGVAKRSRTLSSETEDAEDPDVVFGRHVANELKLITDMRSKQFAKLQIHSVLFNAQFGLTTIPNDVINALTGSTSKS